MDAVLLKTLNEADAHAVAELIAACAKADETAYDPCLDADFYYLVRNEEPKESGCAAALCAVLCGFRLGETMNGRDVLEIQAFTHPDLRQLGFFSLCFNSLRDDFRAFSFRFAVKGSAADETLKALSATYLYDECFMKKTLARGIADPEDSLCRREGEVHFSPYNAHTLYLYGLLVYERFRAQGYGKALMRAVEAAPSGPYTDILLQVSSANTPAYSLYQALGYEAIERISYYTV